MTSRIYGKLVKLYQPPINVVRTAARAVSPIKTPHGAVKSPEGTHLAAGILCINTVTEPFTIRFGGPTGGGGIGGCIMPGGALMMPEQTTAQPTCAAGSISIITGPIIPGGHGPVGGGPTMPLGAMESCDIGSPFRAAGNIITSILLATINVVLLSHIFYRSGICLSKTPV